MVQIWLHKIISINKIFMKENVKNWKHTGMIWQLNKSKYIRFKNIHFSLKTGFSSTLSITNSLIRYEIIFIITHEKQISSPWAHGDLLMSSLWVHSDQNAEPWPSREFTVIKMLTVTICFLVGFPHRSGSTCILFCSIRNWFWPFGSKSHLPQIQSN